jgi:hypothetical protein
VEAADERVCLMCGRCWGDDEGGGDRARSHCHFARPLVHFTPDSLTYSVPLFLKRQCDRTLGGDAGGGPWQRCQQEHGRAPAELGSRPRRDRLDRAPLLAWLAPGGSVIEC